MIIRTPNVIKENARGFLSCTIQDEMFANREIHCIGDIDQESVNSLISQILYLSSQDPQGEITMYINSRGGEVDSGLALYDVMQATDCPIRTVCLGIAASMGALLFVAGDKREIFPHGKIMIHDPLITNGLGGSALNIKTISDNLLRTREITGKILAKHTGKTLEEIFEKTATDSYFYAEEAIKYGLADNIIDSLKGR